MPRKKLHGVITSYYLTLFKVLVFVLLSTIAFLSYRYHIDTTHIEQVEQEKFSLQAKRIEQSLITSSQSLFDIKSYANTYLQQTHEVESVKIVEQLKQKQDLFYSKSISSLNLSKSAYLKGETRGVGKINLLGQSLYDEINMANRLVPYFAKAQQEHPEIERLYYLSLNQFVTFYPQSQNEPVAYSNDLIALDFIQKIKRNPTQANTLTWQTFTHYENVNIKVLRAGLGIYHQNILIGVVFVDIKLAALANSFEDTFASNFDSSIYLYDKDDLLIYSKNPPLKEATRDKKIVLATNNNLINQASLMDEHWTLLKTTPYSILHQNTFNTYVGTIGVLFLLLLIACYCLYVLTHKTFILPTRRFLKQLTHSSSIDSSAENSNNYHWGDYLKAVIDAQRENKRLTRQLRKQEYLLNADIDGFEVAANEQDHVFLKSAMNAIPDSLIFNDLQGAIIGCNQAFEELTAQSITDIIGKNAGALLNNELGDSILDLPNQYAEIASESGYQKIIETVNHTYELFCTHFFNDAEQVIGTVILIRDATSQYASQAAMQFAKEQSEHANKAKSQFLANMSHEIRTPINAIKGMINLLEKSDLTRDQKLHISNAESASNTLLHLIDELLDLAKIESGNMQLSKQACYLDEIVDQAIQLNINLVNKNQLNLIIEIESDVPHKILTDEMRLVQVLTNLINNAVKFTHAGEIRLMIETTAHGGDNALVRFRVIDNGIGIDKDKQGRLFEAFKQADDSMTRKYGGSGLGLSICQQIVNLLEGEIVCKSEKDVGTEFSFVLPLRTEKELEKESFVDHVNIFAHNMKLPQTLVSGFEQIGWQYKAALPSSYDETSDVTKSVLLVSSQQISTLEDYDFSQVALIAVCHPMGFDYQSNDIDLLETFSAPYVLLESPLYRAHIGKISSALSSLDQPDQSLNKAAENPQELEGVNVLLVEDNLVNQLVAKELLKTMKAKVIIAENGQVAIDALEKEKIDIVLMDIQMPVMDGLTATRKIRQFKKYDELPIIAMTAHARQEDKDASMAAGMNMHIAKPIQRDALLLNILLLLKP